MHKRYSIAEARDQLAAIIHEVEQGPAVELTRRGKPVAVLVSAGEYAGLRLSRPSLAAATAAFRRANPFREADYAKAFDGLRDEVPGREVEL